MLRTDYKDDILDSSLTARKYLINDNGDGTVSFQDESTYQQTGDTFGAADLNATNTAVNKCKEYLSGTLPANSDTVTISDNNGFFNENGNVEVYVPGAKVQDLVVKEITLTNASVVVKFSSTVNTATEIRVICK